VRYKVQGLGADVRSIDRTGTTWICAKVKYTKLKRMLLSGRVVNSTSTTVPDTRRIRTQIVH
jgi:hypothetical protein